MKNKMLISTLLVTSILIQACGTEETTQKELPVTPVPEQRNNEITPVTTLEPVSPPQTSQPKQEEPKKTTLTKEEFNTLFELDPEEKQYADGKIQLKDGTITEVDYLMYSKNDTFAYGMAIFHEGKLASIQIETDKSEEEILKGLGLTSTEEVKVEKDMTGFELTFDQKFHESNIAIYPNEWD